MAAYSMATKRTKPARRPKAATADILGRAPDNAHVPVKWRKHFTRLKRLRDGRRVMGKVFDDGDAVDLERGEAGRCFVALAHDFRHRSDLP